MYQKFFGFSEKPFEVTPDPRFLFLSSHHQEALSSIIYGIQERRGFITLVGEVGTGKTTLLNATLDILNDNVQTAFIFNTDIDFDALMQMVLIEFDLASSDESVPKYVALDRLNRFATHQFAAGGNVALFIDEAQNLDTRTMENLRLLSNLETQRHKLIQIVLSGQPELDEKLRKKELRQLAQRINMRRYITPLNETDTYLYIQQHLEKSGYKDKHLFDRTALKQIWAYSEGVPRKINLLCDNALLIAYGLEKKRITRLIVDEAIRDLSWSPYENKTSPVEMQGETNPLTARSFDFRWPGIAAILLLSIFLGAGTFGILYYQNDIIAISQKTGGAVKGVLGSLDTEASVPKKGLPENAGKRPGQESTGESEVKLDSGSAEPGSDIDSGVNSPEKKKETNPEKIGGIDPESSESSDKDSTRTDPALQDPGNSRESKQHQVESASVRMPRETGEDKGVKRPQFDADAMKKEMTGAKNVLFLPESGRRLSSEPVAKPAGIIQGGNHRNASVQHVIVEEGDFLARIVKQYYGKNTEEIMTLVIRANPFIQSPDLILPGQVIRLPKID